MNCDNRQPRGLGLPTGQCLVAFSTQSVAQVQFNFLSASVYNIERGSPRWHQGALPIKDLLDEKPFLKLPIAVFQPPLNPFPSGTPTTRKLPQSTPTPPLRLPTSGQPTMLGPSRHLHPPMAHCRAWGRLLRACEAPHSCCGSQSGQFNTLDLQLAGDRAKVPPLSNHDLIPDFQLLVSRSWFLEVSDSYYVYVLCYV